MIDAPAEITGYRVYKGRRGPPPPDGLRGVISGRPEISGCGGSEISRPRWAEIEVLWHGSAIALSLLELLGGVIEGVLVGVTFSGIAFVINGV